MNDSESVCDPDPNGVGWVETPYICTAPIKVRIVQITQQTIHAAIGYLIRQINTACAKNDVPLYVSLVDG